MRINYTYTKQLREQTIIYILYSEKRSPRFKFFFMNSNYSRRMQYSFLKCHQIQLRLFSYLKNVTVFVLRGRQARFSVPITSMYVGCFQKNRLLLEIFDEKILLKMEQC